jgi:cytochrome P450
MESAPMTAPNDNAASAAHWSCYTASPSESLALFERLRGQCPVAHSDEHEGFHLLLNWRDVRAAMSDHRTFSSQPQVLRPMLPRKPIPALEMDPPQHREWRAIYNEAIKRLDTAAMADFLRARIGHHLDIVRSQGECDIVSALCEPLPAEAICRLMGIEEPQKIADVREAAIAMFAAQGDPEAFGQRQAEFAVIAVNEIHARKANPRDDFLTYLAGIEVEGHQLDDDDYVVLLAAFLGAGHHSTTSAMASLIWEVFSHAELRGRLKANASLIPAAVEEALRLHPPFFGFFRRTTREVEMPGVTLAQGQDVYCGWAAANRDPTEFEMPATFDIERPNPRHMSFGFGIHSCPGAPLARMELTILLEELLDRVPDLEPIGDPPEYAFGGGDYAFIPELLVRFNSRPTQERI